MRISSFSDIAITPNTNTTAQTVASLTPDPTNSLELQSTTLRIQKQNITLVNIYIPPSSSTDNNFQLNIQQLNTLNNTYILGDFNAKDPLWLTTQVSDNRGDAIINQLSNHNILNNPHTPTRKPFDPNTRQSSPDISFASPDIALRTSWRAVHDLSSDHLPLIITHTLRRPHPTNP